MTAAVSWPKFPYSASVRISLGCSVLVVSLLFAWGAWQRRWIADDGLIVLRTVRNLLAGNGPVFNAGERVEANTSTAWTYLMYLGGRVGGPVRLEYVALALALALSVAGVGLACQARLPLLCLRRRSKTRSGPTPCSSARRRMRGGARALTALRQPMPQLPGREPPRRVQTYISRRPVP